MFEGVLQKNVSHIKNNILHFVRISSITYLQNESGNKLLSEACGGTTFYYRGVTHWGDSLGPTG